MRRTRPRPRTPSRGRLLAELDPASREPGGRDAAGTAGTTATHFVGIDVSRDTPGAAVLGPDGRPRGKRFANAPAGHAALREWAGRRTARGAAHFCVAAAGPYSAAIAEHLHAAGRLVRVANPARVKARMRACGRANKTDPADARAIAPVARDRRPRAWVPPAPEVREPEALAGRRDDRRRPAAAEKIRLAAPGLTAAARRPLARVIKPLTEEAARVRAEAEAVVAASPAPAADGALLESVSGIGRPTATTVPAELPPVAPLPGAPSAAAYVGLAPTGFASGKSVKERTRLSTAGNARLRTALYLPAPAAVRSNPVLEGSFDRLVEAGKPPTQAVGGGHAEAGHDLLRGARESRPARPRVVVTNHPLTTRRLVRRPGPRRPAGERPAARCPRATRPRTPARRPSASRPSTGTPASTPTRPRHPRPARQQTAAAPMRPPPRRPNAGRGL